MEKENENTVYSTIGIKGFNEYFVQVNGVNIHYVSGGEGPVILLIHGWPYTWAEWKNILPKLVKAGYRVIAPDMRGCGESEKPNTVYTKQDIAEDFNQLTDLLGIDELYLMGIDIGMMSAYAFAATYPNKVKKVILGEGALPGFGLEELMNPASGGSWHFGFQMQAEFAARSIQGNEAFYYANFWKMMAPVKGVTELTTDTYLKHYGNEEGSRGGFFHYASLPEDAAFNRSNPNKKLRMPVMVINGDKGIPQFITEQSIRQIADNIRTCLVPDCGHTLAEENPTETVKNILQFIND